MRPLWKGSISFGLVSIPVQMYSASESREGIDFDMLHKADNSPIRFARICKKDGEEVAWEDIIKGYQYEEGHYVTFTKKELEEMETEKSSTIDIQQFTAEDDIDIRYFEKPYYLEPSKGGEKAYALLRSALNKAGVLALVKYVFHEREHLGVIKPVGRALVLTQMRFPTDLHRDTGLAFPTDKDVTAAELEMAQKLIKHGTKPFIAEDYHDTYTEELEAVIKSKVKGHKPSKAKKKTAPETSAANLMDALKASLTKETTKK